MNLASKLCVLFVLWVIFGGVSICGACSVWTIKLIRIDHSDYDELLTELLNGMSNGIFGYEKDDTTKDAARKVEAIVGEPVWKMLLQAFAEWPKFLPLVTMRLDEAYDYAVNKYGLKESKKSAS